MRNSTPNSRFTEPSDQCPVIAVVTSNTRFDTGGSVCVEVGAGANVGAEIREGVGVCVGVGEVFGSLVWVGIGGEVDSIRAVGMGPIAKLRVCVGGSRFKTGSVGSGPTGASTMGVPDGPAFRTDVGSAEHEIISMANALGQLRGRASPCTHSLKTCGCSSLTP